MHQHEKTLKKTIRQRPHSIYKTPRQRFNRRNSSNRSLPKPPTQNQKLPKKTPTTCRPNPNTPNPLTSNVPKSDPSQSAPSTNSNSTCSEDFATFFRNYPPAQEHLSQRARTTRPQTATLEQALSVRRVASGANAADRAFPGARGRGGGRSEIGRPRSRRGLREDGR